ncbi:DUF1328 domain-containing protein [Brucella sp. IR073]|uniref:DUF1328 domain-containing protein n=1 Tax=unclassified Brucella TaxID=2632610 RepID=UPI003B97EFB9
MLHWIIVLFIVAVIASFLGFHGIAGVAATGVRLLIFVGLILLLLAVLFGGFIPR